MKKYIRCNQITASYKYTCNDCNQEFIRDNSDITICEYCNSKNITSEELSTPVIDTKSLLPEKTTLGSLHRNYSNLAADVFVLHLRNRPLFLSQTGPRPICDNTYVFNSEAAAKATNRFTTSQSYYVRKAKLKDGKLFF